MSGGLTNEDLIEQQRAHFDSIAERYHEGRQDKNHIAIKDAIWHAALSGVEFPDVDRLKVLEPMCGTGEGRAILQGHLRHSFDYAGFDYSEEMVARARTNDPTANIWHGDATSYVPPADKYDVIILIGGLHHIPGNAKEAVTRLTGGLRKGGLFINFEPTAGNPVFTAIRDLIYSRNDVFDEETERAFSVKEYHAMFIDAGLEAAQISYPGLLAYVMYYNPYAFPLLNRGGAEMVRAIYGFDRLFERNLIGRTFSFATLGIWRKP